MEWQSLWGLWINWHLWSQENPRKVSSLKSASWTHLGFTSLLCEKERWLIRKSGGWRSWMTWLKSMSHLVENGLDANPLVLVEHHEFALCVSDRFQSFPHVILFVFKNAQAYSETVINTRESDLRSLRQKQNAWGSTASFKIGQNMKIIFNWRWCPVAKSAKNLLPILLNLWISFAMTSRTTMYEKTFLCFAMLIYGTSGARPLR